MNTKIIIFSRADNALPSKTSQRAEVVVTVTNNNPSVSRAEGGGQREARILA
jgi:hypothetical protein